MTLVKHYAKLHMLAPGIITFVILYLH